MRRAYTGYASASKTARFATWLICCPKRNKSEFGRGARGQPHPQPVSVSLRLETLWMHVDILFMRRFMSTHNVIRCVSPESSSPLLLLCVSECQCQCPELVRLFRGFTQRSPEIPSQRSSVDQRKEFRPHLRYLKKLANILERRTNELRLYTP